MLYQVWGTLICVFLYQGNGILDHPAHGFPGLLHCQPPLMPCELTPFCPRCADPQYWQTRVQRYPSSGAFIHQVSFLGLADAEQIQLCAAQLWAPAAAAAWSWVLLRAPYELNKRGSRIWRQSLRRATRASAAKLAAISLNLILLLLNTTFTCCTRCDAPVCVALCI